jgi:hypothetical protein
MKKIAFSLLACLALVASASAGHQMASGKDYKGTPPPPCFQDQEFQLDLFGLHGWTTDGPHDDGFGGGLGLNFFFIRNLGIGIDGSVRDADGGDVLWTASASLIVRFPIEGSVCVNPYILAGGGVQGNDQTEGEVHAGGGLEFRVNPGLGIFAEGRYYWADDVEQAQARLGLRFAF